MSFGRASHLGVLALLLTIPALTGCLCRQTIPPHCVRPNILDAPKSRMQPVDFLRLRQDTPPVYLLGPRDILGIYIESVLEDPDGAPPRAARLRRRPS